MADSLVVSITQSVVDQINEKSDYEIGSITAVRRWMPILKIADNTRSVYVVPQAKELPDFDRDGTEVHISVDVVIQAALTNVTDNDPIDLLSRLVEQIENQFRIKDLQSEQGWYHTMVREQLFDLERLNTLSEFVVVITLVFHAIIDKE